MNAGLNELITRIIWGLFEQIVLNAQYISMKFIDIVDKMKETKFKKYLEKTGWALFDVAEYYTF